MKAFITTGALTTAALISAPANAALTSYAFSGSLIDGTKFDGAFTADDTKESFEQFSDYYANLGGMKLDKLSMLGTGTGNGDFFSITFSDYVTSFKLSMHADFNYNFKLTGLRLGELNSDYTSTIKGGKVISGSGTISLAGNAAVPEPATWAMMILGFGVVGGALRRRKVSASVRLA